MLTALFWLASTKLRRQARQHYVTYRSLMMHPSGDDLSFLAQLAGKRALEVITDRVFPFGRSRTPSPTSSRAAPTAR